MIKNKSKTKKYTIIKRTKKCKQKGGGRKSKYRPVHGMTNEVLTTRQTHITKSGQQVTYYVNSTNGSIYSKDNRGKLQLNPQLKQSLNIIKNKNKMSTENLFTLASTIRNQSLQQSLQQYQDKQNGDHY
jgi:hypothetical protein